MVYLAACVAALWLAIVLLSDTFFPREFGLIFAVLGLGLGWAGIQTLRLSRRRPGRTSPRFSLLVGAALLAALVLVPLLALLPLLMTLADAS